MLKLYGNLFHGNGLAVPGLGAIKTRYFTSTRNPDRPEQG